MSDLNPYEEGFAVVLEVALDRIKKLEAKLAKAVGLIDDILCDQDAEGCGCELCTSYLDRIAELTGGKDE